MRNIKFYVQNNNDMVVVMRRLLECGKTLINKKVSTPCIVMIKDNTVTCEADLNKFFEQNEYEESTMCEFFEKFRSDIEIFKAKDKVLARKSIEENWELKYFYSYGKGSSLGLINPEVFCKDSLDSNTINPYDHCIPYNAKTKRLLGTNKPFGFEVELFREK